MIANERHGALGTYLDEVGQYELLSSEDEIKLSKKAKRGNKRAREQMIQGNLRLVVKIANEYSDLGVPVVDLISEGNIGLMKAVDRFDPKRGNKFSTYAVWWIKQGIRRALANQSRTIRLPTHLVEKLAKLRRLSAQLREELGREPTDNELSEELGIPLRKIRQMRRVSLAPTSLDATMSEDGERSMADMVPDEKSVDPAEAVSEASVHRVLEKVWPMLDDRERTILEYRYPRNGDKPLVLEEIGEKFNLTRERIRQIQNEALMKLRRGIEAYEEVTIPEEMEGLAA